MSWSGFVASDNDQLLPIRQLELFKERSQVMNDDSLDGDEKKSQLAEIDAKLESLSRRMESLES